MKIEVFETKQVTKQSVISNPYTVYLLALKEFVNQFTMHGMNSVKLTTNFG